MNGPRRVLIVNDSATMRAALRGALTGVSDVVVVGELADANRIVEEVGSRTPDVVLMDIVMPGIDGYEATRRIMAARPTPIALVTSALNPRDVNVALDALRSGALSILAAPPAPSDPKYAEARDELLKMVRVAATMRLKPRNPPRSISPSPPARSERTPVQSIGIVASTGGPAALVELLAALPTTPLPPILVVQHIAPGFAPGLTSWLASGTKRDVRLAEDGVTAERGCVYLPPEDRHLGLDARRRLVVDAAPPIGLFRPSATFLLRSLALACGPSALGVVLTGMGSDGAEGAVALRRAGARVVGQDERSSVVFGMAAAARAMGGLDELVPLGEMAEWIMREVEARCDS